MSRAALSSLVLLLSTVFLAPVTIAKDASVEARMDARGLKYELDGDDDYKVTFNYSSEGRSQLVFVSGSTETVNGLQIREVFAPAGRVGRDAIGGKKALELLTESRQNKLGSWEIQGDILYFVIKLPDSIDASQLEAALSIAAEMADNKELELSGDKDEL